MNGGYYMVRFCGSCGEKLSDEDKFCFACGSKVQESFSNQSNDVGGLKGKLLNRGQKKLKERFDGMRDDVSHLIPVAAQKLNASPNDCYLTVKSTKHEHGQISGTKW